MDIGKMIASRCVLPKPENALPHRKDVIAPPDVHAVLKTSFPTVVEAPLSQLQVGMGCFWGAERKFWELEGVVYTAVGYGGGFTENATYGDVCTGTTGHTELVWVVFDESKISLDKILSAFWESHDPTQGMRQGNDVGSQYRSAIYCYSEEQLAQVQRVKDDYQALLTQNDLTDITTDIALAKPFYFAESDHQQYLYKNPNGYCGLNGTGVCF